MEKPTRCRVTINTQGNRPGGYVIADLADAQIRRMVERGILVPEPLDGEPVETPAPPVGVVDTEALRRELGLDEAPE